LLTSWFWAQTTGDSAFPWAEYGLAGACLAAVAVFANRSIVREREQHDVIVDSLRAELTAERARHDKDEARIIAQRDSMIDDFFRAALPLLSRTAEVLEKVLYVLERVDGERGRGER
jgi:hypothetical protein